MSRDDFRLNSGFDDDADGWTLYEWGARETAEIAALEAMFALPTREPEGAR